RVRAPVEPAVAGLDPEAGALEQVLPLGYRQPGQHHRPPAGLAAHRQGQPALALVPVRALPDPGLALEPASVRLVDVVPGRREDVEDQAAAVDEQLACRAQRGEALLVAVEVEVRAKGTGDQRDALV